MKRIPYIFLLSALLFLAACQKPAADVSENPPSAESTAVEESQSLPTSAPQDSLPAISASPKEEKNTSLLVPEGTILQERILPPDGFSRIPAEPGSFGDFVRNYPMLTDGSPVLLYDGSEKSNQNAKVAVFDMDVISSADLQQCADSVMRIYAEYFRQTDQPERIRFHFVDGFLFDYLTYRDGGRLKMENDKASWKYTAGYDDSDEAFENYLYLLFAYSSTLSMEEESHPIVPQEIQIGDLFLKGGSPGHVMMVADVCEDENGHKAFLLAQGYMPAQQFHIVKNPSSEENPWYDTEQITYPFCTPEYTFPEESLKRPVYLDE